MENVKDIVSSRWYDDDMFVIHFASCPSDEDFGIDGVTEEVVMSYHKDLDKWFVDKLYLDGDGNCVACDSDDFSPSERNEYIKIGKLEIIKKFR